MSEVYGVVQDGRVALAVAGQPTPTIVQDYLCARAGSERVAIAMARCFPGARFIAGLYSPEDTYDEARQLRIEVLTINRIPVLRRNHRLAFPLLAPAFGRLRSTSDVTLCSSTGWSHGVRAEGRKVVYWHSPAKWLYSRETYRGAGSFVARLALRIGRRSLEDWDRRAVASVDRHLCNSHAVRDRLRAVYGIDAEIVYPPASRTPSRPRKPRRAPLTGFILCVCRLLPYKNVDAIVYAMTLLPDAHLVVAGSGPMERALKRTAPSNVTFLRDLSESELSWLYENCALLVQASFEDFGLTPVEAASAGRPSVVLGQGGFLDTVVPKTTGVFFDMPTPASIAAAIRAALALDWDAGVIKEHAKRFSFDAFRESLLNVVREESAG
jgi:glycosyltransferase involved in cell wall biosynthesis